MRPGREDRHIADVGCHPFRFGHRGRVLQGHSLLCRKRWLRSKCLDSDAWTRLLRHRWDRTQARGGARLDPPSRPRQQEVFPVRLMAPWKLLQSVPRRLPFRDLGPPPGGFAFADSLPSQKTLHLSSLDKPAHASAAKHIPAKQPVGGHRVSSRELQAYTRKSQRSGLAENQRVLSRQLLTLRQLDF